MQALAERLHQLLEGTRFGTPEVIQFAGLKTFTPAPESLAGARVGSVGRRGKYLVVDLGGPKVLVHLSQGGRVQIETPPKRTRPKQGVVRFTFEPDIAILVKEYGTQRKAGWWIVEEGSDGPLERLGPEPDSDAFAEFIRQGSDGRRLHTMLRDQRTVAGIGRGYADDILHAAKLSPYSSLSSLDAEGRERLLDATAEVLERALSLERERTGGLPDKLSGRFSVHGRSGEACPACGEPLKRVSFEGYEIAYCPSCQTGGKILADRRLSRLLK